MDERLRELERRFRESGGDEARRAVQAARVRVAAAPPVGLVFLDDLGSHAPWLSNRAPPWRAERGLDGPLLPPTVLPPPVVVAVAPSAEAVLDSAPWLRLAGSVVVVALGDAAPASDAVPGATWIAVGRRGLDPAVDDALARVAGTAGGPWTWLADAGGAPPASPSGPWLKILWRHEPPTLAPRLCLPAGRPALLEAGAGTRLDLLTGRRTLVAGLAVDAEGSIVAAAPSGSGWFWSPTHRGSFTWAEEGRAPTVTPGRWGGQAIGIDPAGRVAWAGTRMYYHWRAPTPEGFVFWTPSSHDWPCGHGKKLYSYEDNDPLWVHLAPDASACLSVYEHDVLLTPGLPLRWRDVGAFALAERAQGEPRALLFQRSDDPDAFPGDPLLADEDARDRRATVTLGPSPGARYAVGLEAPTYRLAGGEVVRVGGPEDAWLVFDDAHREVQRHRGRLLAGWDRTVVVLRDERLRRVDLLSGEDEDLGPPGRPVAEALAVPGTRNVLLQGDGFVRLV